MGRVLGHTAAGLEFSERTLRRYVNDGLLRARRVGRQLELPPEEERYLRAHHELLRALRAALRTERKVRLAVLFGSMATGDDTPASDVDLLVALEDERVSYLLSLGARLSDALERDVHVIPLQDAHESPALLADVLEEGRVIIDRDGLWDRLLDERDRIFERAAQRDAELMAAAARSLAAARAEAA